MNPNVAMDLISEVPPEKVADRVVSCEGGDAALGHPRVFINLVRLFSISPRSHYELSCYMFMLKLVSISK